MCGFFFSNRKQDISNKRTLESVKSLLFQRGPDSQIIYKNSIGVFVFTRLSIIDLDERSSQPMHSKENAFSIMHNGEIYNYLELKKRFFKSINLNTKSDTEVFLKLWEKKGKSCLKYLRGMYAFFVYERVKNKVFFGRDTLGIKPLYYSHNKLDLVVSSETNVFREIGFNNLNKNIIDETIIFGSPGDDRTGLNNVKRCIPGYIYSFDLDTGELNYTKSSYQEFSKLKTKDHFYKTTNTRNLIDIVESKLIESLKFHLRSDVGYSIQLSGGVDSSLLTALATKITKKNQTTFGLKIEDSEQDESWARKLVVREYKCQHTEVPINSKIYAKYFQKATKVLDSPIVHTGSPAIMRLYEIMRKNSPVAITGEGADEAFMGYSRYREADRLKRIGLISKYIPEFLIKSTKYIHSLSYTRNRNPVMFASVYSDTTRIIETFPKLFKDGKFKNPRTIQNFSNIREEINAYDKKYYLQTLLHRQDLLSMASSVECRTPFADSEIFSLADHLPINEKVNQLETKKLLKSIALKYLPKSIIYRKKIGLTIPLEKWLREEELFIEKLEWLKSKNSFLSGLSDFKKLDGNITAFIKGDLSLKEFDVFRLLCLEEWLKKFDNK